MSHSSASPRAYLAITLVAAVTAALASASALALGVPVWAMFIGWIAFFSRGLTTRSTLENLGCVWLGLTLGAVAASVIGLLAPTLGPLLAVPLVVFTVAVLVVGLRGLPVLNNLLGYFLGLVAWFAAHLEPSLESLAHLAGAGTLGSAAGWVSHHVPKRFLTA
ncbi:DUF1097 domain-containing protein [Pseudomonas entomophila]|uniref:DUF1097 domain-containing protein n=1 Tax=Pseudomonas entomophila TaxID=312306 RepID=UPI0023D7E3AA|nr:DUF1097 domain-containing protein [Pseudomonas entomophila]MDF0733090.1 DUF1097 domain-containing protein [Pseudomonas entomophila]